MDVSNLLNAPTHAESFDTSIHSQRLSNSCSAESTSTDVIVAESKCSAIQYPTLPSARWLIKEVEHRIYLNAQLGLRTRCACSCSSPIGITRMPWLSRPPKLQLKHNYRFNPISPKSLCSKATSSQNGGRGMPRTAINSVVYADVQYTHPPSCEYPYSQSYTLSDSPVSSYDYPDYDSFLSPSLSPATSSVPLPHRQPPSSSSSSPRSRSQPQSQSQVQPEPHHIITAPETEQEQYHNGRLLFTWTKVSEDRTPPLSPTQTQSQSPNVTPPLRTPPSRSSDPDPRTTTAKQEQRHNQGLADEDVMVIDQDSIASTAFDLSPKSTPTTMEIPATKHIHIPARQYRKYARRRSMFNCFVEL